MKETEKQELDSTTQESSEVTTEIPEEEVQTEIQPESGAEQEEKVVSDVASNGSSKTPLIIALVALVLAVGGLGIGYNKFTELNASLQQGQQTLTQLQAGQNENKGRLDESSKSFAAQQAVFTSQDEMLKKERARLEQQGAEMKKSLDGVFERIGRSSTQWIVAEAEYLMRIANHRLQLEGDAITALVALETADIRLRDSGDPAWTGIREKLASEMAELKSIKMLDLAGNASRLSGLISQVENLRLPQHGPVVATGDNAKAKAKKEMNVDTVLRDGWEGFKSLMVIRKNDRPLTAMLGPEQRFFLYQNLRLQLESARMALLRRDQSLFDSSLERAVKWVGEFFDQDDASTKAMAAGIGELKGLQVKPSLPDISGSLRMLLQKQRMISETEKASK